MSSSQSAAHDGARHRWRFLATAPRLGPPAAIIAAFALATMAGWMAGFSAHAPVRFFHRYALLLWPSLFFFGSGVGALLSWRLRRAHSVTEQPNPNAHTFAPMEHGAVALGATQLVLGHELKPGANVCAQDNQVSAMALAQSLLPKTTQALLDVVAQVLAPADVALFVRQAPNVAVCRARVPEHCAVQGLGDALHAAWQNPIEEKNGARILIQEHASARQSVAFWAPIWASDGKLFGAIVGRRATHMPWAPPDLTLLGGIATQLGLAHGLESALRLSRQDLLRMEELATTDGLTSLYNHRHFQQLFVVQLARAKRYKRRLALIMMDIDFFKRINDTLGHPFGDQVLRHVAKTLRQTARWTDVVARYGGEEFAVVMEQTDLLGAMSMAERIRKALADTPLAEGEHARVTCSLGIAAFPQHGDHVDALMQAADEALYQAKKTGRDRAVIYVPKKAYNQAT